MYMGNFQRMDNTSRTLKIEPAFNFFKRLIGLIGRRDLSEKCGFWIVPCSSVHTAFMRFNIDVVFVKDQNVVKVVPNLPPWRMAICRGATSVVELSAGSIERMGIQKLDRFNWKPLSKEREACFD